MLSLTLLVTGTILVSVSSSLLSEIVYKNVCMKTKEGEE